MWIFSDPVETKPVGFFLQLQFRSAVSVLQRVGEGGGGEADVLNLQMAEVNLRSVSEVCGGGWFGGGMTIGFRERAM